MYFLHCNKTKSKILGLLTHTALNKTSVKLKNDFSFPKVSFHDRMKLNQIV